MVVVSAPGKLILMGEHGAVYGLPALTVALGLRVRAEFRTAGPGVEVDLPDLGVQARSDWRRIREDVDRARARWQAFRDGAPFARDEDPASVARLALGEAAAKAGSGEELPGLRLRVTSELPVGAGFGSSAAVAVAVVAGFLAWRGVEPSEARVAPLALEVERRQHGSPSGVDHGTVLRGGVQWAERDAGGELRLRPLAVAGPQLAAFGVYDSGPPAESTGAVVAAVAGRRRQAPADFDAVLARMRRATDEFRDALEGGAGGDPAPPVRAFERCLEGLGVVPEPVRRAVRDVERAGGAAKVSGAGALSGVSAGCLLTWLPAGLPAWRQPAGWRRIGCAMGAPGLRLEAA